MAYRIRIILDVKEDVIRDLIVAETFNLEELHFTIAKSYGFKGKEMASFYQTDNKWEQGEEIPLFDMSENGNSLTMNTCLVSDIFKNVGDKLIYVYDFMAMWTFFVELAEITDSKEEGLPKVALSFGNAPDEAPEKEFKSEKPLDDIDAFEDGNNLENIDDFDFDNY
jgi:Plasmid pRiA4b ORF-3-like protein